MKIRLINCSAAIAAILIILGIGFAPITRLVPHVCTTTQPYTCETTQYYDCNISREILVRGDTCYPPTWCYLEHYVYSMEKIQVFTINGCSEQIESTCYTQEPNICYEKETQRLWW